MVIEFFQCDLMLFVKEHEDGALQERASHDELMITHEFDCT
jgi:hypothetical protein